MRKAWERSILVARVGKQLKPLYKFKECTLFDPHGNVKLSNVLFVTLTCDTKRFTIREAWETIGSDLTTGSGTSAKSMEASLIFAVGKRQNEVIRMSIS